MSIRSNVVAYNSITNSIITNFLENGTANCSRNIMRYIAHNITNSIITNCLQIVQYNIGIFIIIIKNKVASYSGSAIVSHATPSPRAGVWRARVYALFTHAPSLPVIRLFSVNSRVMRLASADSTNCGGHSDTDHRLYPEVSGRGKTSWVTHALHSHKSLA